MAGYLYQDESVSETSSCGLGGESSCFGDDVVMLGEVDWELVRYHQGYTGSPENEVLRLLAPGVLEGVRVGTGTMWVRKGDNPHMATIHRMEPAPKGRIIDLEGALHTDWIQTCLAQEAPEAKDTLWNLLKAQYPSLVRGDATSPTAMPDGNGPPFPIDMNSSLGEVQMPEALQERQPYAADPPAPSSMNGSGYGTPVFSDQQGGSMNNSVNDGAPPPLDSSQGWYGGPPPHGMGPNEGYGNQVLPDGGAPPPQGRFPPAPLQPQHVAQGYGAMGYDMHTPTHAENNSPTHFGGSMSGSGYGMPPSHRGYDPNGPFATLQLVLPVVRSKIGWMLRNDDLVVTEITDQSPAQAAGVQPGMRIVTLAGHPCYTVDDVRMVLQNVGTVFECVVSTELLQRKPPTPSHAHAHAHHDDSVMSCMLHKAPHEKMGTVWMAADHLVLKSVDPGTAADMAGCGSFVGWRLTHVNSSPVYSSHDIVREAAGQSALHLMWAKMPPQQGYPHPGQEEMQNMHPHHAPHTHQHGPYGAEHSQQPQQQQQQPSSTKSGRHQRGVAKPVTVFAPSLLWVIAPERVHHCGGLYRLQEHPVNEQPCWQHVVTKLLLYASAKGLWCVSDSVVTGNGWIFSMLPSVYGMPDTIPDWEAMGEHDAHIKVVSQLPIPGVLTLKAAHPKLETLRGTYNLMRDQDETGLPFKVVNGMPVWEGEKNGRYLYSSRKGTWFITDDVSDFARGGGSLCGKAGHGGMMPFEQGVWVTRDNVERPDVSISLPNTDASPAPSPPPPAAAATAAAAAQQPAKVNATASVHENSVWKYEDFGSFNLASYLERHAAGHHLLWGAPHSRTGYLGIDLSSDAQRGHLVKMLTELVDQECIAVAQPIVAGVTVVSTAPIATPEGTFIETGVKGQVVSVTSGRTPIGNLAPRMARVNFMGTTVTVSYGQVDPVQGAFERGAKVRVLAVDAVALVDSEMVPTGGVGVRGKYRIKYATGKTYHVRNFALITADKPWGEGDEIQEAGKFPEGSQVQLAETIVFASLEAVPRGAVGVVTNYNGHGEFEVLSRGCLFVVTEAQLKAGPGVARGALVAPQVLREDGEQKAAPQWTVARVQAVLAEKADKQAECMLLTPSGAIVRETIDKLMPIHFVEGQEARVLVASGKDEGEVWVTGTVDAVLPSGAPLITAADADVAPRTYWFAAPTYTASAGAVPHEVRVVQEGPDEDPLGAMGSYITMDPAMLNEAEIMRRKWLDALRLTEAVALRRAAIEEAARLKRLEATRHSVQLRKDEGEPMGTVFHDASMLLLQKVGEGSAAWRCGVGRFVGRTLVAIDGQAVKTTEHVKQAAAGKTSMTLEFEQAPYCPEGHQLPIIFNPDTASSGTCPGCFMPFNVAYYSCSECKYDVCGSCGKANHMDAPPAVAEEQAKAAAQRRQSDGSLMSSSKASEAGSDKSGGRKRDTRSASSSSVLSGATRSGGLFGAFGGSWGSTAFASSGSGDSTVYSGMSWGSLSVAELAKKAEKKAAAKAEDAKPAAVAAAPADSALATILNGEAQSGSKQAPAKASEPTTPVGKGDGDIFGTFGSLSKLLDRASELPTSPEHHVGDEHADGGAWKPDAAEKRVY